MATALGVESGRNRRRRGWGRQGHAVESRNGGALASKLRGRLAPSLRMADQSKSYGEAGGCQEAPIFGVGDLPYLFVGVVSFVTATLCRSDGGSRQGCIFCFASSYLPKHPRVQPRLLKEGNGNLARHDADIVIVGLAEELAEDALLLRGEVHDLRRIGSRLRRHAAVCGSTMACRGGRRDGGDGGDQRGGKGRWRLYRRWGQDARICRGRGNTGLGRDDVAIAMGKLKLTKEPPEGKQLKIARRKTDFGGAGRQAATGMGVWPRREAG